MGKAKDIYAVTVVTEEYAGRATGASIGGSRRNAEDTEDLPTLSALTMRSPEDRDNPDAASLIAAGRALQALGRKLEKRGLKIVDRAAGRARVKVEAEKPIERGEKVVAWWVGGPLGGRTVGSPQQPHRYDHLCQENDAAGSTRHERVVA